MTSPLLVCGAGSWGTALAVQAAKKPQAVRLWGRSTDLLLQVAKHRENKKYLKGVILPDSLAVCSTLEEACEGIKTLVLAVPSSAIEPLLKQLANHLPQDAHFIVATKGFWLTESGEIKLIQHCITHYFPKAGCSILSGPSFAAELANGLPTAVAFSSVESDLAKQSRDLFHFGSFRGYTNTDPIATQLGGAVKNVLAIAAGIADGLGFGANARAALVTRGLAEITSLAVAMGGEDSTLLGLAGVGDLVLTCTDNQSRNRQFGLLLGQGVSQEAAVEKIGQVVEGVTAAKSVCFLANQYAQELPISKKVYQVLYEGAEPRQAVIELFERAPKQENFN